MEKTNTSTRRTFIQTAGAALSVPLAAAAHAGASAAPSGEPLEVRLARLEDEHAIRLLNQEFARCVNADDRAAAAALHQDASGMPVDAELCAIAADEPGREDDIEIAADRRSATATLHRSVQFEHRIGPSCTLVEMAREQGGGVVRHAERGVFEHTYVRREGLWKIQRSVYRAVLPAEPTASSAATASRLRSTRS